MSTKLFPLVLAAALAVPALAACSAGDTGSGDDIAALKSAITELERTNERQTAKIEKLERRVSGNGEDIDRLAAAALQPGRITPAVADAGDGEDNAGMANAETVLAEGGAALAKLLETDKGQELVGKAMEAADERRRSARMQDWATSMVDRFAERAELTPDQRTKMLDISTRSMTKIRDVWSSMRDARNMSPEERADLMTDNRAKMEGIREDANEEAKGVLNSAQYLIYEEEVANMSRGFGGRARGGNDGGNRGR